MCQNAGQYLSVARSRLGYIHPNMSNFRTQQLSVFQMFDKSSGNHFSLRSTLKVSK